MLLGFSTNALGPLESIHDCIEFLWPPYGKNKVYGKVKILDLELRLKSWILPVTKHV